MSSTAWATSGHGFDSQGKHIMIKHIPSFNALKVILDKRIYQIEIKTNIILYPTISLIHIGPSHLCVFCELYSRPLSFLHKRLTHMRHLSIRHLQCTFLTDVPGKGDSCIPELSKPAKHTALQVWCRRTTRLLQRGGHRVKHQGSKGKLQEEWTATAALHS